MAGPLPPRGPSRRGYQSRRGSGDHGRRERSRSERTPSLEVLPSPDPESPHPVHLEALINRGVFILEMVYLEQLARDHVYEFAFICLPLRIRGATGSWVRPVAICERLGRPSSVYYQHVAVRLVGDRLTYALAQ